MLSLHFLNRFLRVKIEPFRCQCFGRLAVSSSLCEPFRPPRIGGRLSSRFPSLWSCSLYPKIIEASVEESVDALVHNGAFILENFPPWWDEQDELGDGEGAYPFSGILMIMGDITKNDAQ